MINIKKTLRTLYSTKIVIILLLILTVYFNTIHSPFHYDDIGVAIKRDIIEGSLSEFWKKTTDIFIYRLFLLYSFALNYHWGDGNVLSYHVINIIFHFLSSLLIYSILKNILNHNLLFNKHLEPHQKSSHLTSIPFLSSLIFAVHPLNTETVTFISSRSSGMVTFFFLLSLYLFIKGTSTVYFPEKANHRRAFFYYIFSIVAFLTGLGTKETIATLPAIIILYIYYFVNREKSLYEFLIKFKRYFIAVAIPAVAYLAHRQITVGSIFLPQAEEGMHLYGRYYYFLTELKVIIFYYLKLFLFPINLNVYPMMSPSTSIFDFMVFISLFIILSLIAFALIINWGRQHIVQNKIFSFSILWFFITLLPSSSFIPLNDLIAEHRAYLPAVGASMFFGAVLYNLLSSLRGHFKLYIFRSFPVVIILILFSLLSIQRNFVWKDDYTLWRDSAQKTPHYAKPHINLGVEYNNRGLNDLAVKEFKIAIQLLPDHAESHYDLGKVYADLKQYDKAISEYLLAIQYKETNQTAFFSLGNAYSETGQFYKAIEAFNRANQVFRSKYSKDYIDAVHNSGEVYGKMGQLDKAIEQFQKVLKTDPDHILANENLARGYQYSGDHEKADYYSKKAFSLKQRISEKH